MVYCKKKCTCCFVIDTMVYFKKKCMYVLLHRLCTNIFTNATSHADLIRYRPFLVDDNGTTTRFTSTLFVLLIQCAVNASIGFLGMHMFPKQKQSKSLSLMAEQLPVQVATSINGHTWIAFFSFMYLAAMACR